MTNISSELPDSEELTPDGAAGEEVANTDETAGAEERVDSGELAEASELASELSHADEVDVTDEVSVGQPAAGRNEAGSRTLSPELLQRIVEGALLAASKPLAVEDLSALFEDDERPAPQAIRDALVAIGQQSTNRGFELREVASGFRFQVVQDVAPWIARLWEEKPQKYSRALLETLALIAYRQPITRGDIEDIRGVAVATNIIKTLLERDWVRVVGHKDVPGRPAMYATTRRFLDYFNLKNLDELPPLADLRDLDALSAQLSLEGADTLLPEQQEGEALAEAEPDIQANDQDAAPADVAAAGDDDNDVAAAAAADTAAEIDFPTNAVADSAADSQSRAEDATSTEAAADVDAVTTEPPEPRPDANQSED